MAKSRSTLKKPSISTDTLDTTEVPVVTGESSWTPSTGLEEDAATAKKTAVRAADLDDQTTKALGLARGRRLVRFLGRLISGAVAVVLVGMLLVFVGAWLVPSLGLALLQQAGPVAVDNIPYMLITVGVPQLFFTLLLVVGSIFAVQWIYTGVHVALARLARSLTRAK